MTRTTLHRAVAAMVGISAVLLLVSSVLPMFLLDGSGSVLDWVNDSAWVPLTTTAFALAAVIPFVLVAVYCLDAKGMGMLGFSGLVVTLIGASLYLGFEYDMAFVWPVLVVYAPELIDFIGPMFRDPRFGFVHSWMAPTFLIGALLFGAALFRARVFPRPASVLFVLGLILSVGGVSPPFLIRAVGGLLGAPALAWMAWIVLHLEQNGNDLA